MRVILAYVEPEAKELHSTIRLTVPSKWLSPDAPKRTTCSKLLEAFVRSYNKGREEGTKEWLNIADVELFDDSGRAMSDKPVHNLADETKLNVRSLAAVAKEVDAVADDRRKTAGGRYMNSKGTGKAFPAPKGYMAASGTVVQPVRKPGEPLPQVGALVA